MGIASLILGSIALVTGWIPFVCFFAFILAIIGLILGIVDAVKKSKANDNKKWFGIAGLIISAIAIPIIIIVSALTFGIMVTAIEDDYNEYDYYYDYYNDYYDDDWYDNFYDEFYDNYYNQLNNHNAI